MIFFHSTNCSNKAVVVPKTWENVSPVMLFGKAGSGSVYQPLDRPCGSECLLSYGYINFR